MHYFLALRKYLVDLREAERGAYEEASVQSDGMNVVDVDKELSKERT